MVDRDFFADDVTNDDEDAFLADALGDDPAAGEGLDDDAALSDDDSAALDDQEDLDEDDTDDEPDEGDDLDAEADPDALPSPVEDYAGWYATLEDDERQFMDAIVERANLAQEAGQAIIQVVSEAQRHISRMEQRVRLAGLVTRINDARANMDEQQWARFTGDFRRSIQQFQTQRNQSEVQQIRQGLQGWVANTVERDAHSALLAHVKAGEPLTMDDGSQITIRNLTPIEEQLLRSQPNGAAFDRAIYAIQAARRGSTEQAREALRTQRRRAGADAGSVRQHGGARGSSRNYDNYDPKNLDAYLDDVMSGAASG